jgi:hypothetical protein
MKEKNDQRRRIIFFSLEKQVLWAFALRSLIFLVFILILGSGLRPSGKVHENRT